jgi:uncharacterized Zn finger protein
LYISSLLQEEASAADQSSTVESIRLELEQLYTQHCADKLTNIPALMLEYEGREQELLVKVKRKYVQSSTVESPRLEKTKDVQSSTVESPRLEKTKDPNPQADDSSTMYIVSAVVALVLIVAFALRK